MPKTIRLNTIQYFIMKIPNIRELHQITSNHLCGIDFEDVVKLYKDYTKEQHSFVVNDTTFPSNNPLKFRENLL